MSHLMVSTFQNIILVIQNGQNNKLLFINLLSFNKILF